jgi:hypothetical protein
LFKSVWNLKQYLTIILVQSLPSECKDKLLNLLSPSASKGCSKSKFNWEIVQSVD